MISSRLGDGPPDDERYDRPTEYACLLPRLLEGEVTTLTARYYRATHPKL
jgi:hypothetical protein